MIPIMLDDGVTQVYLTRVDHVTTAETAAQALWESVYKQHGTAHMILPEDRDDNAYGVRWGGGPSQWADAYIVSEGADAREFATFAENGDTVFFKDLD